MCCSMAQDTKIEVGAPSGPSGVCDCGHPVIGCKLEECGIELGPGTDVDQMRPSRKHEFFERNLGFPAVWCWPKIQIDHRRLRYSEGYDAVFWFVSKGRLMRGGENIRNQRGSLSGGSACRKAANGTASL